MLDNNNNLESTAAAFICEKTNLPQEYINLTKNCPLEDKLLCKKCKEKYTDSTSLIPIKEFIQKAKRAFLTESFSDLEYMKKELKHQSQNIRLKFDHFRVSFIEAFLKLSQNVEKLVDTRISTLFHIAKENYLDKLNLLDNPNPSYDVISLTLSILKVLNIKETKEDFQFEIKLPVDIKEELKKLKKDTQVELDPYSEMFDKIEKFLAQLKDPSTFDFGGVSITKWNFKAKDTSMFGSIDNHSQALEPLTFRTHLSTPASLRGKNSIFNGTNSSHSSKGRAYTEKWDDSINEIYERALTHVGGPTHNKQEKVTTEIQINKVNEVALLKEMNQVKSLFLNLSGHQINQKNCFDIVEAIRHQSELQVLKIDLSNNSPGMSRDSLRDILSAINTLSNLKRLNMNLRINNISPLEMAAISSFYSKLTCLEELDLLLSFNAIGDDGLVSFAKVLSKSFKLKKLRLDFQKTKTTGLGLRSLFESIAFLKNLQTLELVISDNKIDDQDVIALSKALNELYELKQLDIQCSNSELKDDSVIALTGSITNYLDNLNQLGLDLQFNMIGYNGIKELLTALNEKKDVKKAAINFLDNKGMANVKVNELKNIVGAMNHCQIKCKL